MTFSSTFKFCPHCASPLDNFFHAELTRGKCPSRDWIHYRNPTVGVAVVLVEDEQLLIGRGSEFFLEFKLYSTSTIPRMTRLRCQIGALLQTRFSE